MRFDFATDLNPLIRGLLERLPAAGSEFSMADRSRWLKAAASIFNLIYPDDAEAGEAVCAELSSRSARSDDKEPNAQSIEGVAKP